LHDSDYSRLVMNRLIYRARSYDSRRLYVKVPKTHTVAASLCKEVGFSLAPQAAAQPDDHEHYVLHLQGDDLYAYCDWFGRTSRIFSALVSTGIARGRYRGRRYSDVK